MIVQDEMTNHSANRFYADLAEYQLHAARLALAARDRPRAEELWQQACKLLIAYGWHKDITIFELLDPFPALINADRMRARARLEGLQGLCERVPLHTDLKETRHAWSRWWTLLALADPVAAVELVAKQSLSECNDPHELLSGAMEDVWNEKHEDVDPTLSGLLRLTLDSPMTQADAMQLKLLADGSGGSEESTRVLMTWLLARADERPISYSVTNSPELIANDDEVLAGINEIAGIVDLPKVLAVSDATEEIDESESSAPDRAGRRPIRTTGNTEYDGFPPGSLGIARAIRVWRSRPYESLEPEWNTDRFANVIGYRLLELLSEARQQEASSTLQSLADASGLGDRGGILRAIAEGLDRHGANELAAIAYTFVWTRARSGGGWLTFGGTENIDALERASVLAPNISHRIVADEIAQAVTNPRFGTYGISQAVIHALTVGAVGCPGMSASESAFSTWDEAYAVISERAPRVDTSDDPEHPYISDSNAGSRAIPNNLETAFALATLTSLGDASREKKRRTLIAAQMLLNGYPDVAAPAFNYALRTISDPATLTWLLRLIEHATAGNGRVNHYCQETLRDLAQRDHLTVRALARRLLTGDEPPIPRPTPADQALLDGFDRTILIASGDNAHARDATPGLDELITSAAGERLWRGEEILPGLTEALRSRVAIMMAEEGTKKRLRRQLRSFALGQRSRPPDAFLAYEQGVEECLQLAAAGGREARLIAGEPIVDPIDWEDGLASAILDDPIAAIALESTRQPRPLLAPPPTRGSNIWTGVRSLANGGAEGSIESALERGGLLFSTLRMESVDALPLPQVDHASFAGWRWLATIEQRWIKQPRSQNDGTLLSERYRAVEIRNQHDRQALDRMPLMSGDSRTWENETGFTQERASLELTQPLIGVYEAPLTQNNGRHGLGFPGSLLTPTIPLATLLGLRPSSLFSLEDDNGIGLALVVWRAEYDTSEYYLAWPRIVGCGIAIRPDLLARLVSLIGEDRIISRDFVIGDSDLATE
jgi:hypothetical protein